MKRKRRCVARGAAFGAVLLCTAWIGTVSAQQSSAGADATIEELASDLEAIEDEVRAASVSANDMAAILAEVEEIRVQPREDAAPLRTAKPGEAFTVNGRFGDWYSVELSPPVQSSKSGWLPARAARIEVQQSPPANGSFADRAVGKLLSMVRNMREKYRDNEYVRVTGFTVDVGLPPSVSVGFEFVEQTETSGPE